jgi:3-hydroxybutyrate dehydrogenase
MIATTLGKHRRLDVLEAQIDSQAKMHRVSREQVIRDVLLAQQPNKRFATVEELK